MKENKSITKTYLEIAVPYIEARGNGFDVSLPIVSAVELARRMDLNQSNGATAVCNQILANSLNFESDGVAKQLVLFDCDGNQIQSSTQLKTAAIESASYKRVAKRAQYESRAPNGGPVVKSRIVESRIPTLSVEMGAQKLRVAPIDIEIDDIRREQLEQIRMTQAQRQLTKYSMFENQEEAEASDNTVFPNNTNIFIDDVGLTQESVSILRGLMPQRELVFYTPDELSAILLPKIDQFLKQTGNQKVLFITPLMGGRIITNTLPFLKTNPNFELVEVQTRRDNQGQRPWLSTPKITTGYDLVVIVDDVVVTGSTALSLRERYPVTPCVLISWFISARFKDTKSFDDVICSIKYSSESGQITPINSLSTLCNTNRPEILKGFADKYSSRELISFIKSIGGESL